MEEQRLTIQAYVDDGWHDAATVRFIEPGRGIAGKTIVQYDDPYYFDLAVVDALDGAVVDRRALSVRLPVDLETSGLPTWPAWLLDLMPQGNARQRIAQRVGLRADDPSVELHLLLEAGGSPIGNLRVKEAWQAERERLAGVECPPLTVVHPVFETPVCGDQAANGTAVAAC